MEVSQAISLFGKENCDKICSFLLEHYLKSCTAEEVRQLIAELNCEERENDDSLYFQYMKGRPVKT